MLTDKLINKAFNAAESLISTDRSRCVRMRFNKNTCSICTASCRAKAISIDGGIAVDVNKCTECMQCVSECPSGCFTAREENFSILLSKLKKPQSSLSNTVLGCKRARDTDAHVKTCCLGFLSEEHMIALSEYLDKPLSLNLTDCAGCKNAFIVQLLKERLERVGTKISFDIGKRILLTEKKVDLFIEDVPLDRRSFFQTLKTMTFTQVAGLIDNSDNDKFLSYSTKRLPLKRDTLNTVLRELANSNTVADILHNYAFTVKAGSSCTNCFACIGMCPTGALKIKKDEEGSGLLFNSSLCIGCGLCSDFCPDAAMNVFPGYFGNNYFEHIIMRNAEAMPARAVKDQLLIANI
jgi:ferredoxin